VFDYQEMTGRNIGFVSAGEQVALRDGCVFICGVGGMGGAAVMTLARAGVGNLVIADFDVFEPSNLNRQLFAFDDTLGKEKTDVTRERLIAIDPELRVTVVGRDWPSRLDELFSECRVVINGMDDVAAGIGLYRAARDHGATVIDAYTSPLPSVAVVRPRDPRPEERLGFPTVGVALDAIAPEMRDECLKREIEYVLVHSSSAEHVDMAVAADVIAGKRSRMSFAPMVVTTGCLMAFEAIALLLGRETTTDCRGWFFNPRDAAVERPHRLPVAWLRRRLVRRFMSRSLVPNG
jgi:molybdopterin/thiamine biosynthesis adenylyltransferase